MNPIIRNSLGVLGCAALVCLCVLLVSLCRAVISTEAAIADMPSHLERIEANASAGVDAALSRIDGVLGRADAAIEIVKTTATNADARTGQALDLLATTEKDAHNILDLARIDLNSQLATANQALGSTAAGTNSALASVAADLHAASVPIASTAAQVSDAAPLFLDCEFNPDCAFNRFQGVSKAVEQMSQAGAKAAPEMVKTAQQIETSAAGIALDAKREADAFTASKTFLQKVQAYLILAGEIFAHWW